MTKNKALFGVGVCIMAIGAAIMICGVIVATPTSDGFAIVLAACLGGGLTASIGGSIIETAMG